MLHKLEQLKQHETTGALHSEPQRTNNPLSNRLAGEIKYALPS